MYYSIDSKQVLKDLKTTEKGLTTTEVEERVKEYGRNVLQEKNKTTILDIIIDQFTSPLVWILIGAVIVSFLLNEVTDALLILGIIILNTILGFYQEYRAEKTIEALKKITGLQAKVYRNGVEQKISSEELVPGDVILLETGDKVPADARIIEQTNLQSLESALTGESTPVEKQEKPVSKSALIGDQHSMVFSGTNIVSGRAKAVVCATGMSTEIGKVAALISESEGETPLQIKMDDLSKKIGLIVIGVTLIVTAAGVLRGDELFEIFLVGVALAVAAIPEGLPAVITVGLAIGINRMAGKNALIRKLSGAETLGSCTVICSDKTGTLTHNQMTVKKLFVNNKIIDVPGSGYDPSISFKTKSKEELLLLEIGALNNHSRLLREQNEWTVAGDPTEGALLVAARKAGLSEEKLLKEKPITSEIEFTSERKLMTTIHEDVVYCKGASEELLAKCAFKQEDGVTKKLTDVDKKAILKTTIDLASNGLRVLAFAFKEGDVKEPEKNLIFVGLQAMIDPPRKEVKQAIQECAQAGIKVVMITGDHLATAKAIAKELGITGDAITGNEIEELKNFDEIVEKIGVYARVNPAHKMKIVKALQAKGHVVAMTGDGINDAPALKQAEIGIAMGITGTDVSKEASTMILADDNFLSIKTAVEEGRRVYDNIRKYLAYLFSGNITEVLVIFISILLNLPLPLVAVQLLWINLVTDGLPALALSFEPKEDNIMKKPPRKKNESIFKDMNHYIISYPLILTAGIILMFASTYAQDLMKAQTMAFTTIVLAELFQAISAKNLDKPVINSKLFSNKWLILAVLGSFILQLGIIYTPFNKLFELTPLSIIDWIPITIIALGCFLYLEVTKWFLHHKVKPNKNQ
ncbi:calcium-translocating P-type ATPase, SERCA-type [Candidatus Micrarchaeota archaeon]|nr:calcium-translocating P-type ATPase, SERCA-type [Candidatus Micrarchaeota archaeon]